MIEKLKSFIDALFANAPKTQEALEAKEELLTNVTDKYNDCIAQGKSEETAFNLAVASIGDISEVLISLAASDKCSYKSSVTDEQKSHKSLLKSSLLLITVIMYLCISFTTEAWNMTWLLFLLSIGASNVIELVYTENPKRAHGLVSVAWWCCVTAVYISVSLVTRMFWITWLIFIFALGIQSLIELMFTSFSKKQFKIVMLALWAVCTLIFTVVGLKTGNWRNIWIYYLVSMVIINIASIVLTSKAFSTVIEGRKIRGK